MHDRALRQSFTDVFARSATPAVQAFARCVLDPRGGQRACWGNLAEDVERMFVETSDSLAFWQALVEVDDARALLVFLDLSRGRREVLGGVARSVSTLPAIVQCALVVMPEVEGLISAEADLHPAARELLASDAATRLLEHEVHQARMRALRAWRAGSLLDEATPAES